MAGTLPRATLPTWALRRGLNLDRLRELIRGDGKLRALGERFGGVRIYTALDMEVIQAAYEKRQEAKGKQKAGAE